MARTERLLNNPYPAEFADKIIEYVCKDAGIELNDISKRCRTQELADSRKIISYLCDKYVCIPLWMVAKKFNQRNHTTVSIQKNKCIDLMQFDKAFRSRVEKIEADIFLN